MKAFISQSTFGGWVSLGLAILLSALIIRGLINTPEHTVTPLGQYTQQAGVVKSRNCGETPTHKTVLYFEVAGDDIVYEARTRRLECDYLLTSIQEGSHLRYWVHPDARNWVGQITVSESIVISHSDYREDAWSGWRNAVVILSIVAALLFYYALIGQFRRNGRPK
jgi:hypothetical protein